MRYSDNLKNNLKSVYTQKLADDFYKPVLQESILYQRVSGYFSSAGIDLYIDGLEELAKNNGQVEYIISKTISKEDYKKIKAGYDLLEELKPLKLAEQNERLNTKVQAQLGNLAFMIAIGRAKVKVALTDRGIFHDKFGLVYSKSEIISFNGSANETYGGINSNYESISVDFSWDTSENVKSRINYNKERFNRLWNNQEPGVEVIEVSELAYEEIAKYQDLSDVTEKIDPIQSEPIDLADIEKNVIYFDIRNNKVVRLDNSEQNITNCDRKLRKGSDLSIYFEEDNSTIISTTTYKDIERIIDVTIQRGKRKGIVTVVSNAVEEFIARNKYSIEHYKILGNTYKGDLDSFPEDKLLAFRNFSSIVQEEVLRPLYDIHLRSAYFQYEMGKAANFSVPGAGKTAMILGVFAYLNRKNVNNNEKVSRMLVICPLNAFGSWRSEFLAVFGSKKILNSIDTQSNGSFEDKLNLSWKVSNLILVNYESLPKYAAQLKQLIDSETMLIFDEVHRIKNPEGIRAQAALEIVREPKFKYVLTGTPIPNSYQDIYNFLWILYGNEYNSFFGWDLEELKNPRIRKINEINRKINPFFWRTNKNDLEVPIAEPDYIEIVEPSNDQLNLAELIYKNEKSSLAKLIRLIQASTNPSLVKHAINYNELMAYDDSGEINSISEKEFDELLDYSDGEVTNKKYSSLNLDSMISPKFKRGIELVSSLVSEGKKVLVWGIFVDTINKIHLSLIDLNIKSNVVYGGTPHSDRQDLIDEFRYGDVRVLITNPQTLGESISLHQNVHDAVYFEYNFNLTFMLQSRDRIHRLGLDKNQYTRYYYLQTKDEEWSSYKPGFIDQKIYGRLKEKEEIMYSAIDDRTLEIEYSMDEILEAIKIIDQERRRISRTKNPSQ